MAKSNSNIIYVEFNGVDLSGDFTSAMAFDQTNATKEVTSGSGATHIQRNPGLNDTKIAFSITYDDAEAERDLWLPSLKPGQKGTLIYVPGGRVAGNPVHEQVCIVAGSAGPNVDIAKAHQTLALTFDTDEEPVRNINEDKWP